MKADLVIRRDSPGMLMGLRVQLDNPQDEQLMEELRGLAEKHGVNSTEVIWFITEHSDRHKLLAAARREMSYNYHKNLVWKDIEDGQISLKMPILFIVYAVVSTIVGYFIFR